MIKGSAFPCYYGAKSQIVERVLPHFPRGAETYVETCFGSGALFFALPEGLYPNRVINDLNKGVVTFYKVLRERPDDLVRVCELTPYAFDEQRACRDWTQDPEDELELARRVWVRQSQNFAGMQQTIEGFRRGAPKCSIAKVVQNKLAQLHEYAKFFNGVEINNTDAVDLVRYYGKPGVFLYEDPPYHPESRGADHGYQHEMDAAWHEKLLEANLEASNKGALIAISGYPSNFYDRAYKDWRRVEYSANAKSANFLEAEDRQKTEVIWMNYPESVEIRHGFKPKFTASNKLEQVLQKTLKREGRTR